MSKYAGLFGMFEMEKAAERVVELQKGNPDQPIGPDQFYESADGNNTLLIGFSELLFHGWLEKPKKSHPYNGVFIPSLEFLRRTAEARKQTL